MPTEQLQLAARTGTGALGDTWLERAMLTADVSLFAARWVVLRRGSALLRRPVELAWRSLA